MAKFKPKIESDRPDHWLTWVVRLASGAALLAPVYVSRMALSFGSFTNSTLWQSCAWIAVAAWLVLAFADRRYRPDWRHPVVLAATALVAWMLLSLIWSQNAPLSFWSTRRRVMGTYHYLLYYAWFLALIAVCRDRWIEWRRLLFVTNAVALVIGLSALADWFKIGQDDRVGGSLGNPVHLGAYAALHVLVALMLFFGARSRWAKTGFAACALFQGFVVFSLAATRSASFALAVGLTVGAAIFFFSEVRSRRLRVAGLISLFAVVILTAGLFGYVRSRPELYRDTRLPMLVRRVALADLGADRLALWRLGWQGFLDKPVLGWGLESYELIFNLHFDPAGADRAIVDTWDDRCHNQFLGIAFSLGAIGFLIYLGLWGTAWWSLLRGLRSEADVGRRRLRIAAAAGLVVYAVDVFFFFDAPAHTAVLWLVLAMVAGLRPSGGKPADGVHGAVAPSGPVRPNPLVFGLVLTGLIFGEYYLVWRPYHLSNLNSAGFLQIMSDPPAAAEKFRESLASWSYIDDDLHFRMTDGLVNLNSAAPAAYWRNMRDIAVFAAQEMETTVARHPDNYHVIIGGIYAERLAADFEPERLDKIEALARRGIELAPKRAEAREELAETFAVRGQLDEALRIYREALPYAQYPQGVGRIHFRTALIEAERGDLDAAFAAITLSAGTGFPARQSPQMGVALAKAMPVGTADPRILDYLAKLQAYFGPDHPELLRAEAIAAHRAGDEAQARQLIEKISKIDPATAALTTQDISR